MGHPLTIITGDHSYEITIHVSPEKNCEAGIILQYDDKIYNAVSLRNGCLKIYRLGQCLAAKETGKKAYWLKMRNEEQYVSFYYSEDGVSYHKMNYVINTASQNTHAYNGFLSLRPGIFAVGENAVLFQDFQYTGLK